MKEKSNTLELNCPLPISNYPNITLAHGSGGKLMNELINKMFRETFNNEIINEEHDGALLSIPNGKVAFTTDSYTIKPLFFRGGDIGKLAVYGTVNDLSMCGAIPKYISLSLIIEEGFDTKILWEIIQSIKIATDKTGVKIVTGDTKVINRIKDGDELFINTTGIGIIENNLEIKPTSIKVGDNIILSGDIGRHGISVLSSRENLEFETKLESDLAPLNNIVNELLDSGIEIHCLRDLTRGGLASALVELSKKSDMQFEIQSNEIPVSTPVLSVCELLGFDPVHIANEGRFIIFLPQQQTKKSIQILRKFEQSKLACLIGEVIKSKKGKVILKNEYGSNRILDMFSGELLPRIC
ncbi:MAG: hydrogenase expression/formation protein HypE [Ignavibacteriales bacterium]|nr:hydrogenase expression/formation protein HypE [Ignavibacteriales bacterium]